MTLIYMFVDGVRVRRSNVNQMGMGIDLQCTCVPYVGYDIIYEYLYLNNTFTFDWFPL